MKTFIEWLEEFKANLESSPYDVNFNYGDNKLNNRIEALEKELKADDIERTGHMSDMTAEEHKYLMSKHLEAGGYYQNAGIDKEASRHFHMALLHQYGAQFADKRDKSHDLPDSHGTFYPMPKGIHADPYSHGASAE